MGIPVCPLKVAATFAGTIDSDSEMLACTGSRCAWWHRDVQPPGEEHGWCGATMNGQRFLDPARATTRQTTPKVKG